jgi:hypothetical protein
MPPSEDLNKVHIHKAAPFEQWAANQLGTACRHCGSEIKRVPGGDGPVWVHTETGAVVGKAVAAND